MTGAIRHESVEGMEDKLLTTWDDSVSDESCFSTAIRLRHLFYAIAHTVPTGSKILETGFGNGNSAQLLTEIGYHVTAIENDQILVDHLQSKCTYYIERGTMEILKIGMNILPWENDTFDLVYHHGVLEYFSDEMIVNALQEQARVARWIVFMVPNHRIIRRPTIGNERLLRPYRWRQLIKIAGL